jgi:hypothetical protein
VLNAKGKAKIVKGYPVFTPDGDYMDPESGNAWQVVPLFDVHRTSIEIKSGIFQHNNISNGSAASKATTATVASAAASLMAYGPAQTHRLRLAGGDQAIVRGGGNLMNVYWLDWDGSSTRAFYPANIWDYAGRLPTGESYSILGSAGIILNAAVNPDAVENSIWNAGRSVTFTAAADEDDAGDWDIVGHDMFGYFGFYPYNLQQTKTVCLGATQFAPVIGFVNLDTQNVLYPTTMERIVRSDDPASINGDIRQSLNVGYIDARDDGPNDPTVFGNRNS